MFMAPVAAAFTAAVLLTLGIALLLPPPAVESAALPLGAAVREGANVEMNKYNTKKMLDEEKCMSIMK